MVEVLIVNVKLTNELITAVGADGAEGMLKIQQAGGKTIAQDEATSAILGMPKAATELGAVDQTLPDYKIANAISVLSDVPP